MGPNDLHFATAATVGEAGKFTEVGFECVCHDDGVMLRKHK